MNKYKILREEIRIEEDEHCDCGKIEYLDIFVEYLDENEPCDIAEFTKRELDREGSGAAWCSLKDKVLIVTLELYCVG